MPSSLVVARVEAVEGDDIIPEPLGRHQRLIVMDPQIIPEQADHGPQFGHFLETKELLATTLHATEKISRQNKVK